MSGNYQRKLTIISIIILVVLGLSYGTVYLLCKIYLQPAKIKEILVNQVQQRFDRNISLSDDIHLTIDWDMSPNLVLHNFTLSNSTWASQPHIFTADTIELNFSLTDLLFKNLNIYSINLVKPQLFIEINDKQNNISDLEKDTNSPGERKINLNIQKISLEDGLFVYNIDKFKIQNLDLKIKDTSKFHLNLQGSHEDLPIKATIDIELMKSYFKLNIINLLMEKSDLSGNLAIEYDPIRVTGEFKSNNFNIKDFTTDNPNPSGEYTIPSVAIPVAMLKGSEFDVSAEFKKLLVAGINISNVNVKASNNKNVLTIQLSPAATIAGGKLNLNLSYDLNPKTPTLSIDAKTSTLQLENVLKEMFGKSPIAGSTLDFSANLKSSGADLHSIVGSLHGKILITAGPGQFLNESASLGNIFTNVLTSVITFNKEKPSSAFSCGVMNFTVTDGVARAKQGIGIEAANVNVLGNGMVDLRNGKISFSMAPQTISVNPIDLANFSVAQFVSISGTISKPEISINPVNVLTQGAGAIVSTGIASGIGGIAAALAGAKIIPEGTTAGTISPCKTALGN